MRAGTCRIKRTQAVKRVYFPTYKIHLFLVKRLEAFFK